MSAQPTTVLDRIKRVVTDFSIIQLIFILSVFLALSLSLFALQEPAVHAALHDFRHGAGIVCH